MSKNYFLKDSHTNFKTLKEKTDKDIDLSEIPEIRQNQIAESTLRYKGEQLSKGKVRVNILLDEQIVAYFKTLAGGRGYQTLINQELRQSMLRENLETTLRRIVREELKAAD